MKKKLSFLLLFCLSIFGCETDFEVNAPWKETMVIYGLLDQSKAVQIIKINKAFLGEGDANLFAQNTDSINYDPKDLKVVVYETSSNGSILDSLIFHDSIISNKKPGDFSTTKNIVYVSYQKLDSNYVYKLSVKNLKTGNIATASTSLLQRIRYSKPSPDPNNTTISFVLSASSPSTNGSYSDLTTSWTTKPNAKTYQTNLRFYYLEKNLSTNIIEEKYVDWLQSAKQSQSISGNELIAQSISGLGFYQLLGSEIPINNNVFRYASKIVLTMTVGSDELNNYININSPSSDLNQEKPLYTNVNNGLGIFSSRTSSSITKFLCDNSVPSKLCDAGRPSLKELVEGKYTYQLKFKYN